MIAGRRRQSFSDRHEIDLMPDASKHRRGARCEVPVQRHEMVEALGNWA